MAKVGKSGPGLNENSYPAHLHLGIVITNEEEKINIINEEPTTPVKTYSWQLGQISTLYRDGFNHNSEQRLGVIYR